MEKSFLQLFCEPDSKLLASCPLRSSFDSSASAWQVVIHPGAFGGELVGGGDEGLQGVQADRTAGAQPGHFWYKN